MKNIIICFDSISILPIAKNDDYTLDYVSTHVSRLLSVIDLDRENQIAFYTPYGVVVNIAQNGEEIDISGVDTSSILGQRMHELQFSFTTFFGFRSESTVLEGYKFLMNIFNPGDRLFLFGFGRGAFNARMLSGMLIRFGLLLKERKDLILHFSKINKIPIFHQKFKETHCIECNPYFIGVWDTPRSVGFVLSKKFFDNMLSSRVAHGYHAISIDDKRSKFPVALWDESHKHPNQVIEQVWFAGVHSDIGGWYPERDLSDITFAWMIDKIAYCGLRLKENWYHNLNQNPAGLMHESRTGMWRLQKPVVRRIPEGARVHQSVLDRMKIIPDYKPLLPRNYEVVNNPSYTFK